MGKLFQLEGLSERTDGCARMKGNICVNKRVIAFGACKPKGKDSREIS
jgi:hypothetical protein